MPDASSQSARTVAGASADLRALWLGGEADRASVEAILPLLREATHAACRRWRRIYKRAGVVSLIVPAAGPPPPDWLAETAKALGYGLRRVGGETDFLAAQCDLAIVDNPGGLSRVAQLPALIAAGKEGGAAFFAGDGDQLRKADRENGPFLDPAPATIAEFALAPPHPVSGARNLSDYLAEDTDVKVGRHAYDLLLRLTGQKVSADGGGDDSWDRALDVARRARPQALETLEALRAQYDRADALALAYGRRWRSTLVSRSLLLLLTSICSGVIGALFHSWTVVTIPIQIASTVLIFLDTRHATHARWREKWIEYRRLAESLRSTRFLVLCGVARAHSGDLDWVDWLAERGSRAAFPFNALDETAAPAVLDHLSKVEIGEQIAYNRGAFRRFRKLDRGFRRAANVAIIALTALGVTLGALALIPNSPASVSFASALSLALMAAPSLYGALNTVRREFDVTRQAKRAAQIARGLSRLARLVAQSPVNAQVAEAAALRAQAIMGEAVSVWRSVVGVI